MKPFSRRLYALSAIALAAVLFVAVNIVSNFWLSAARVDLTQNGLYTVSNGTKEILSKLQEPITLKFYFSREPASGYAQVVAYAGRVRDLLQEYAALSGGKIILQEIDPAPFTPEEDDAVAQGLTAAPTQEGDNVYFGLVGTNTLNGHEVIPFFDQMREDYLEYDISSLIYKLSLPAKPKLGILSVLPLQTGAGGFAAALQGNSQPFTIYTQLRDAYDIETVDTAADRIPADISTLLVVHPSGLTNATLYAIDQFVMRGGHAIVFVDPLSEVMNLGSPGSPDEGDRTSSTLGPLFKAWGIDFDAGKVVADGELAQPVQVGGPNGQPQVVNYIAWIHATPANFDPNDPITGDLQQLNLATAGALSAAKGATTHFTPLIQSSSTAGLLDAQLVRSLRNPEQLLRRFEPTGAKYTLAARITGAVKTAFPNGPPAAKPADANAKTADKTPLPAQVKDARNINVVVFGDSDMLDDRFWVQVQNVLGQRVAIPSADNGALVLNAVENMMGSNDLISLRTRERSQRPFLVVNELRREAQNRFQAQEDQLQDRLNQTQTALRTLQQKAGGDNQAAGLVLTKAQQAQIDKFRQDLVTTRASLREVQANLRRDVENLGTLLAFLNIALVPILISAFAVGLALWRGRRRAKTRGLA
jgi:gliding motility-associatede transport system auxiliary component